MSEQKYWSMKSRVKLITCDSGALLYCTDIAYTEEKWDEHYFSMKNNFAIIMWLVDTKCAVSKCLQPMCIKIQQTLSPVRAWHPLKVPVKRFHKYQKVLDKSQETNVADRIGATS